MSQPLLPRRKFRKNSRGISSLIAAIFMVIIILFMSFNVFTFTLFKNTQFRDAVDTLNQMDVEQTYETISFSDVSFTRLENDWILVDTQLANDGAVSVKIVSLWVLQSATGKYGHADVSMPDLGPGKTGSLTEPVAAVEFVEIEGEIVPELTGWPESSGGFTAWFITARGNRIPLEDQVVYAQVSQGMGSLVLEFERFRYFLFQSSNNTLLNYPEGVVSFEIPQGVYAGFGIYLQNEDPKKRTITLDGHSLFWQPKRGDVPARSWFIVNVNIENGTIKSIDPQSFSDITIGYGQTTMLVFISANDLETGTTGFAAQKTPAKEGSVATFLVLHGEIGSDSFAQNIPFVSLFYS